MRRVAVSRLLLGIAIVLFAGKTVLALLLLPIHAVLPLLPLQSLLTFTILALRTMATPRSSREGLVR